ncbi:MAG: NAD(P)-binding domain-containing protein [Methylococcales bacterium]|nr:NAD(P)-binding domain-containing protein [Methylococcales bacterium]
MQAGLIGLGSMGVWMARNLAQAGFLTAVYNRTPAKAAALAKELQVLSYDSPEALAAKVDVVFICVSADQDVIEVVNALAKTIKPECVFQKSSV